MMRWLIALIGALGLLGSAAAQESGPTGRILSIDAKGPISVATSMQVSAALEQAETEHAMLVVLRLDTPGGLANATRDLIQSILATSIPVAIYVAPGGARAASAGTYIAYTAHIAAMTPGTHLGAATPIELGGLPGPSRPSDSPRRDADGERKAEAERLRRAKVIDAEGELQAAEKLLQAGQVLTKTPEAMQLRYFGTILNVAGERSSMIIFPVPMDLVQSLSALTERGGRIEKSAS